MYILLEIMKWGGCGEGERQDHRRNHESESNESNQIRSINIERRYTKLRQS